MVSKKVNTRVNTSKYVAAFVLAAFIFLLGLLVGNYVAKIKIGEVERTREKLVAQLTGLELRESLLEKENLCSIPIKSLLEERIKLGSRMAALEARLGKKDAAVIRQKEIYELVEIRTILLLEKVKKVCKKNFSIILFFYTNKEEDPLGDARTCEDQGYVLDTIYRKYPEEVHIFSFDVNIENPATGALFELYNVTVVPTIVINGKVYPGFRRLSELEELLKE